MAPTVRSATGNGESNTPTVNVTKPVGLAVGDLMVAFQLSDADGTLGAMFAPDEGGWNMIGSQAPTPGTNIPAMKVWRKVATSTDVSVSTFDFPDNTGSNCSVVLVAVTAGTFDSTNLTSTPSFDSQGDAIGSTVDAPTVSPGVAGALLLCAFGPDTGDNVMSFATGTAPSGMTLVKESDAGTATWTRVAVYSQVVSSTAATGTKTATIGGGESPNGWVGTSLLVLPSAATGPEGGRFMFAGA